MQPKIPLYHVIQKYNEPDMKLLRFVHYKVGFSEAWLFSQYNDGILADGQVLIPDKQENFLYSTESRPGLMPAQPPIQWVLRALSPEVKWLGNEAPSSAEVNSGRVIPPFPHTFFMTWCLIN
jgi:hypothetical protein